MEQFGMMLLNVLTAVGLSGFIIYNLVKWEWKKDINFIHTHMVTVGGWLMMIFHGGKGPLEWVNIFVGTLTTGSTTVSLIIIWLTLSLWYDRKEHKVSSVNLV